LIRDLRTLADTEFDLLVVGAGIYGAAIAWDAAQRGLTVALIDRADFGGGTSANSMKTVHGGVRSLQTGNPAELRLFVRERRALSRIAPHLVHPLPFVVPTYGGLTRHPLAMQAAFKLYDFLSSDRNAQLDRTRHLPPSRRITRDECLALNPLIDPEGVTGGIVWHDCQMYNPDRVVLAFVQSAAAAGASVANYVDATGWLGAGKQITGMRVEDRLGAGRFDIRARLVVNAAGPWSPQLTATLPPALAAGRPPGFSKAMNLVTRSVGTREAVGGVANGRFLFIAPWRGVSIVGTSHEPYAGSPGSPPISDDDVTRFLTEVRQAFPRAGLGHDDVRLVHRGLLPSADPEGETLSKQSLVRDHRQDGTPGLMSAIGVRYTTARATAAEATDLALKILGQTPRPSQTATTPLAGGDLDDWDSFLDTAVPSDVPLARADRRRLAATYGTGCHMLIEALTADQELASPLSGTCPVTHGEIAHAVRTEMAVALSDAVLRRTEAGSAGHPGPEALKKAADVMGALRSWSSEERAAQIAEVERHYRLNA
jgi:glycerol-3-phosphate dehydrogenase